MTLATLLPYLSPIVLAAALIYSQWRVGGKQVSAEVISNFTALDKQQKEQIAKYEQDIGKIKADMANMEKGLIAQIAKLEGALNEKDKQLKSLQQILANRSPELEQVLGEIRDFMKQLNETNNHQTKILEEGKVREERIDRSTDQQIGHVLRKQ